MNNITLYQSNITLDLTNNRNLEGDLTYSINQGNVDIICKTYVIDFAKDNGGNLSVSNVIGNFVKSFTTGNNYFSIVPNPKFNVVTIDNGVSMHSNNSVSGFYIVNWSNTDLKLSPKGYTGNVVNLSDIPNNSRFRFSISIR